MRKRVRALILAAIVVAVVVPVGFALSPGSNSDTVLAAPATMPLAQMSTQRAPLIAPMLVTTSAAVMALPHVPDGAKLFAIGSVLFGLAAAMKRTSRHDQ